MRLLFIVAVEMASVLLLQRLLGSPGIAPRDFAIVYAPLFFLLIVPSVTYLWRHGQGGNAVLTVATSAAVASVLVLLGRSPRGASGAEQRWFVLAGACLVLLATAGLVALHP